MLLVRRSRTLSWLHCSLHRARLRTRARPSASGRGVRGCWSTLPRLPSPPHASRAASRAAPRSASTKGPCATIIHALKYDGRRSVAPGCRGRLPRAARTARRRRCGRPRPAASPPRARTRLQSGARSRARPRPVQSGAPLRRLRDTRPQVDLPAHERQQNVRDAFGLVPPRPWRRADRLRGAIVVLVDDVTTTGATLEACARTLLAAGAREVRALTAARVATGPR